MTRRNNISTVISTLLESAVELGQDDKDKLLRLAGKFDHALRVRDVKRVQKAADEISKLILEIFS